MTAEIIQMVTNLNFKFEESGSMNDVSYTAEDYDEFYRFYIDEVYDSAMVNRERLNASRQEIDWMKFG